MSKHILDLMSTYVFFSMVVLTWVFLAFIIKDMILAHFNKISWAEASDKVSSGYRAYKSCVFGFSVFMIVMLVVVNFYLYK